MKMTTIMGRKKLQIEVWSDFVCPFCYIGKRHLEAGLTRFAHRDEVEVRWKSFELDPNRVTKPGQTVYEVLARKKGQSVDWAKGVSVEMTGRALQAGLLFDFDRAIPANTFDAHRLSHLAAKHGLQDALEERTMRAYFTEGRNIGSREGLQQLSVEIGLDPEEARRTLESDSFSEDVRRDEDEAQEIGISGVPFFLFNRELAISGAQPVETFESALAQGWTSARSWPIPGLST